MWRGRSGRVVMTGVAAADAVPASKAALRVDFLPGCWMRPDEPLDDENPIDYGPDSSTYDGAGSALA